MLGDTLMLLEARLGRRRLQGRLDRRKFAVSLEVLVQQGIRLGQWWRRRAALAAEKT